ncbi:MAG TPA: MFS transporter [Propionibacteriaceae bacterium]
MPTLSTASQAASTPVPVSTRALTLGLCTTIVAVAFETVAVATALPVAAQHLGGLRHYAWSFSLFLIAMLFSTVLAGRLSDRHGPAKPLAVGLLVFVVGLVVAGTATHMGHLMVGRLVQGLGSGVVNTAIFVGVARAYGERQRPKMFSYISTAWVVPAFIGPPAAAWLTERLSWHWVFFAVIPLVVLGGLLALPRLQDLSRNDWGGAADRSTKPAPIWAAAVVAIAAAALQLAGQRLDLLGLGAAVGALVALTVALPPLMPACFSRLQRGLPAVIVVRGLLAGAFVGGEVFVPLMLVEEKHVALVLAGSALTVGSIGWAVGSWLQSRPWLPIRRDQLIGLGCLFVTVGLGSAGFAAVLPAAPYAVVLAGWIFSGLGMGLATSSTAVAAMALSRPDQQGRNASSLNLSDALGSAIFVGVSGTVFTIVHARAEQPLAFGTPLLLMAALSLLAALTTLRIGALPADPG